MDREDSLQRLCTGGRKQKLSGQAKGERERKMKVEVESEESGERSNQGRPLSDRLCDSAGFAGSDWWGLHGIVEYYVIR